ncbi:hypothetical protein ACVGWR_00480, partial [Enterobacter hormaechei]
FTWWGYHTVNQTFVVFFKPGAPKNNYIYVGDWGINDLQTGQHRQTPPANRTPGLFVVWGVFRKAYL